MAHLVFQTAFPGDLFLSIPLLKNIRAWDPQASLTLACRPGLGEFFSKYGLVDNVIEVDKKAAGGRRRALGQLLRETWDVAFVPHESVRTALWMSRLRARRGKLGFRRYWNGLFFTERVSKPMELPEALRQLSLMSLVKPPMSDQFASPDVVALKNPITRTSPLDLRLAPIPDWASMTVLPRKPTREPRIFLAPGSVWATKRWTLEGYQDLTGLLLKRGFQVHLVGSSAEKPLCDAIVEKYPSVTNHAGKTTLCELAELLQTGTALICNDSAAMHVAAVSELPTVAIFGPTVPRQGFRPWQNRAVIIQRELDCRPCGRHGANKCPLGTHACMVDLPAKDVLRGLDLLL